MKPSMMELFGSQWLTNVGDAKSLERMLRWAIIHRVEDTFGMRLEVIRQVGAENVSVHDFTMDAFLVEDADFIAVLKAVPNSGYCGTFQLQAYANRVGILNRVPDAVISHQPMRPSEAAAIFFQ